MTKTGTYLVALALTVVALLLPPGTMASALVGTVDLVPSATAGFWWTKLTLLLAAGLVSLLPSRLEGYGPSESLVTEGIVTTPSWNRTDWYACLALVAMGMVLRGLGLNEGLWFDEIQTLVDYVRLPVGEILTRYDSQNQHILYSVFAHGAVAAFGESAWTLRLPAAVLGALSIPLTYLFARQIATRSEALLAAAFLAGSYHHVWFSQNARGYTGVLLGTVLASLLFLRLLSSRNVRPGLVVGYAAVAALTVWTHLTAAVTVGAHGIVWLLVTFHRPRRMASPTSLAILGALSLAGLFSLSLYGPVLPQLAGTLSGGTSAPAATEWQNPSWLVLESLRNLSQGIPGGWVALLIGVMVMLVGTISFARQNPMILSLLLLPAGLMGILVLGTGHNLWPRFFFFSAPFAVLIGVRGGTTLIRRVASPEHAGRLELALGLAVVALSTMTVPRAWGPKQDFHAAAEYVTESRSEGDAVITVDMTRFPFYEYLGLEWVAVDSPAELSEIETTHSRTWVLYTFPVRLATTYPGLWNKLQAEYQTATIVPGTVGGGDIVIMVKP